ncbi:Up-regulated during septation-domain-containing protein [Thermothelomyces heterothallicus CBS 202.75]|uniref:Up-regulated during septation-domain-containing protein n=1 Tax=Thermothelomyces heterothallicus CBS 202.75 TaxID=1149848 RepID=UPI00374260F8
MDHIASCLLDTDPEPDLDDLSFGLNNYIAKAVVTPQDANNESIGRSSSPSGDKPFAWRMQQQPERKYQLFPRDKQIAAIPGKPLDPEQAYALAMSQSGEKSEKQTAVTGLRIRVKDHNNLVRRRKISVPELGPMTTVQEAAMDSPTIPGRPPIHERSISAPGSSGKPCTLGDCMTTRKTPPGGERPQLRSAGRSNEELQRPGAETARQPLSPKSLAPLVIPTSNASAPRTAQQVPLSRLRSGSTPVEGSARLARIDDSPRGKTPFTPLSASLTTPRSAATTFTTFTTASTLPTPVSAPAENRGSPRPWEKPTTHPPTGTQKAVPPEPSSATPKVESSDPLQNHAHGHRRHQSESGSIMDRGRPRKRSDAGAALGTGPKRSVSKRSKSTERQAFERLPKGWKADDAVNVLSPPEVATLQRQALQQAARFEVLRKEDVDSLSRELRHLDERTEYLRHTYMSLRSGRRNLHTRVCQYLRSARTAKFSHEAFLKQEEALAELDTSIDEWASKLEQAENRRTRVRQKLLEHVAAAVTLGSPTGSIVGVSESLQLALGVVRPLNAASISTPPRSPAKASFTPASSSSPSPHRAHVPSTILEQPLVEEAADMDTNEAAEEGSKPRRAETIRVYADLDIPALLKDVENTIANMGGPDPSAEGSSCTPLTEAERRQICRTRSHDALNGGAPARKPPPVSKLAEKPSSSSLTSSATAPAPEPAPQDIFLTSAVFKPS